MDELLHGLAPVGMIERSITSRMRHALLYLVRPDAAHRDTVALRMRAHHAQELVRESFEGLLTQQQERPLKPAALAAALRDDVAERLTCLAPGSAGIRAADDPATIVDAALARALVERLIRKRDTAIRTAILTRSRPDGITTPPPVCRWTFEVIAGRRSIGDATYGLCRQCRTGLLYKIRIEPWYQYCGLGRRCLNELEQRHPATRWSTSGQDRRSAGFYDRYRSESTTSPWRPNQRPCLHFL